MVIEMIPIIPIISICISLVAIVINCKILFKRNPKKVESKPVQFIKNPFSAKEYFDRIEKAYNEILEKKERQSDSEEYVIILWWGLDGLRLNKDGSSEWISKKKEEPIKKEQLPLSRQIVKYRGEARTLFELCSMQANIGDMVYVHETALMYAYAGGGSWNPVYRTSSYNTNYQLQQCCCTMDYINSLQAQCMQSTQNRIAELQERDMQLHLQIAQSEQNRRIVETIQGGLGNRCTLQIGMDKGL